MCPILLGLSGVCSREICYNIREDARLFSAKICLNVTQLYLVLFGEWCPLTGGATPLPPLRPPPFPRKMALTGGNLEGQGFTFFGGFLGIDPHILELESVPVNVDKKFQPRRPVSILQNLTREVAFPFTF